MGARRPLVWHITAIAGSDAAMSGWSYFCSCAYTRSFLVTDDPPWCTLFSNVRFWLISMSALWTGALASGALSILLGRPMGIRFVSRSAGIVVSVSVCLCAIIWRMPYDYQTFTRTDYWPAYCALSSSASIIVFAEQLCVLVLIVCVQLFAMVKAHGLPGHSKERRAISIFSRYLAAYIASYGLWTIDTLFRIFGTERRVNSALWMVFETLAWRLLCLNGVFNFAALWFHARDSVTDIRRSHAPANVTFRSNPSTQTEVAFVDQEELRADVEAETCRIQATNAAMWADLGIAYEDGISGEVDLQPVSGSGANANDFAAMCGTGRFM